MGTVIEATAAITVKVPAEVLGPGSEYAKRRIALRGETDSAVQAAQNLTTIDNVEEAENATQIGRVLQAGYKETESFFKAIKVQIDAIKSPILEAEKADLSRIQDSKNRLGVILTRWNSLQEQLRREAEAAAREAAAQIAREEQLQRAIALEQEGQLEAAEEVLNDPTPPPPIVIQASRPAKVSGQVGKTTYAAVVTNLMELVKAVASGKAPIQALQADMTYINGIARLDKEMFNMPGCKLDKKTGTHFRS